MDYGARYYDPVLARFITADTIYDRGSQGLNRYSYALNNPIMYNDPTGHFVNGAHDSEDPTGYGCITGSQAEGGREYIHDGQGFNMPMSQFQGQLPSADPESLKSPYPYRETDPNSYVARSIDQVVRGNYTENVTLLGTGGQLVLGLSGLDLPADIRDAYYDVRHWQWTWGHAGQTGLDLAAFFPLVGMLKYGDETGALLKSSVKASKGGIEIGSSVTRKGVGKIEYLFKSRNDALNWARKQLGDGAERVYDSSGKWIGWQNKVGDNVYWGHGDWGKGVGKSTYPHLNYDIGGTKGHLYLQDKIVNTNMWDAFTKEFGL